MIIVSPSVLSANFLDLRADIEKLNKSKAQWLHYDVMDGNFVPNMSFGPQILKQINQITDKFIDVHIMVSNPKAFVDYFAGCKVDLLTFHIEATKDIEEASELIDYIHSKSIKASISVKPKTDVRVLEPLLHKLDMVLVMSVEPGFGGQKFNPEVLDKCDWLYEYKCQHNLDYHIQIDGGINGETGKQAVKHHCDSLVAGSFCFNNPNGFDSGVETLLALENA